MLNEYAAEVVIGLLVLAAIANTEDDNRSSACTCLLWILAPSYYIYTLDLYNSITAYTGYFVYQALYPLICILILRKIRGRLSTCLIVMCSIDIFVNIGAQLVEGGNEEASESYMTTIWLIFFIEVALMFSRRCTDGFYNGILRLRLACMAFAPKLAASYRASSLQHRIGED